MVCSGTVCSGDKLVVGAGSLAKLILMVHFIASFSLLLYHFHCLFLSAPVSPLATLLSYWGDCTCSCHTAPDLLGLVNGSIVSAIPPPKIQAVLFGKEVVPV